jgi:hypothetical protein
MNNGPEGGIIAFDTHALIAAGFSISENYYQGRGEIEYVLSGHEGLTNDYEIRNILRFVKEIDLPRRAINDLPDAGESEEVSLREVDWEDDVRKFMAFPRLRLF